MDEKKGLEPEILEEAVGIFKILSDATRVSILYLLKKQELNVGAISEALEMEQSAISHQLQLLRSARLVKSRREGRSVIYTQEDDHVYQILDQVLLHAKEKQIETNSAL